MTNIWITFIKLYGLGVLCNFIATTVTFIGVGYQFSKFKSFPGLKIVRKAYVLSLAYVFFVPYLMAIKIIMHGFYLSDWNNIPEVMMSMIYLIAKARNIDSIKNLTDEDKIKAVKLTFMTVLNIPGEIRISEGGENDDTE